MIKRTVVIHIALKIHILKGTYKYYKFCLRIAVILLKKKRKRRFWNDKSRRTIKTVNHKKKY